MHAYFLFPWQVRTITDIQGKKNTGSFSLRTNVTCKHPEASALKPVEETCT